MITQKIADGKRTMKNFDRWIITLQKVLLALQHSEITRLREENEMLRSNVDFVASVAGVNISVPRDLEVI